MWSIVGSLRDREVACSASDRRGLNFKSCVWRTVSSHSSHHPQEVLLAQFSLYVHKGGLKPDSFHFNPANTKHLHNICTMLDQRLRRWADVVQMLYKCFVFAGNSSWSGIAYCWRRWQADTDSMSVKCWASVVSAGQYPFSPSQYFMLPVPACWR